MKKIILFSILASFCYTFILTGCRKDFKPDKENTTGREIVFARNADEKATVEKIKRVGQIVKQIYNDPAVRKEVSAAIKSKYYADETVGLKDLLDPTSSPLFQSAAFTGQQVSYGHFRRKFIETIGKGSAGVNQRAYTDSIQEYFMKGGLTIYFPYCDNFTLEQLESTGLSLFMADRDADEAPGEVEVLDVSGNVARHDPVTGNDPYSEANPCHIIGVNCVVQKSDGLANMYDTIPLPPPVQGRPMAISQVYVGWARSCKTHDAWISFTGNGGGDEMRFNRTSGYLEYDGSNVTGFQNTIMVSIARSDCKNRVWKRVYAPWDPNWRQDNFQQALSVYEEDTEGEKTFTGKLSTTVKKKINGIDVPITGEVSYSHKVLTKDWVFYQQAWDRDAYITTSANYDPLVWQTLMRPILVKKQLRDRTPPSAPEPGVWTVHSNLMFWWSCSLQSSIWRTDGKYWPLHTNDQSNPEFGLMWPYTIL